MDSVQNLFANSTGEAINTFTSLSLDTIILATVFLVFFIYSLKFGKRGIVSLIFSLYISIPIISFFPYLQKITFLGDNVKADIYSQIGLFILLVVLINSIVGRIIDWDIDNGGFKKLIENGALSIAAGGLLIAISYHIVPITALHDFGNLIDSIFASGTLFFWWLAAPLIIIFFTTRR